MNTLLRAVLRFGVGRLLRGSPRWLVILGVLLALAGLTLANGAKGATYVNDCPAADAACIALAERLQAVVVENEAQTALLQSIEESSAITAAEAQYGGGAAEEVSGVVALAEGDAQRIDLVWIGVWLTGGIIFGLVLGKLAWDEFRKWAHT